MKSRFQNLRNLNQSLNKFLTKERIQKIDQILEHRTDEIIAVVEGIYDLGNVNAVMRSAESFGFYNFHVIESSEHYKKANRVTQGADRWLDVQKWKSSVQCLTSLRSAGAQIIVTSLDNDATPIDEIDFDRKTAIVFGNEKDGISQETMAGADRKAKIPMLGMSQSFNISVAAALCFYQISLSRKKTDSPLDGIKREYLKAVYGLRSIRRPESVIKALKPGIRLTDFEARSLVQSWENHEDSMTD